ncbi:Myb family DNA-binding domain-containing protein [Cryptosporidium felis]|nr:Myb family DNA-binding domain-containing protein [Cryptosporidium felis]
MVEGSQKSQCLLEEILTRSREVDSLNLLENLVEKYLEKLQGEFAKKPWESGDLVPGSIFGPTEKYEDEELIFGNARDKLSVLKIQDEILRINVEIEALKKEQEERRASLGVSGDRKMTAPISSTTLEEELDFVETEDMMCDGLDIETGLNNSLGPGTTSQVAASSKEQKAAVRKKKAHRRYFRRKNANTKEKVEIDENEKILRSRTPLDVITLASKYYLRELSSNLETQSDHLQLPIAQDHRRGPHMNLGLGNIRDIKTLNYLNSSLEGMNGMFLKDLCRVYHLESVTFVSRSQMTDKASQGLSYETSFCDGEMGYRTLSPLFGGVELISHDPDSLGTRSDDFDENLQTYCTGGTAELKEVEKGLGSETATGDRQEESEASHSEQDNSHNYNYLASVMEDSGSSFKKARQKVRISVFPGRVKELDSLLKAGCKGNLGKYKVRFLNRNRFSEDGHSDPFQPPSTEGAGEPKGAFSEFLTRMNLEDEERLESVRRLKSEVQRRISRYKVNFEYKGTEIVATGSEKDPGFTVEAENEVRSRLPFLISAHNYLLDEIRMLELTIGTRKGEGVILVPIYMDDLVVNREIQDHLELILGVPENIPLMPYFTSLCYPVSPGDAVGEGGGGYGLSGEKEGREGGRDPVSQLRPIGGDFYHPLNLFGRPEGIKKIQRHIWKRRTLVRNRLLKIRRSLPAIYRAYRRFVANREIKNCEKNVDFTWGCLPLRAIDHPDQIVPLPIGYFKHDFRFKAYHKFLDLLPEYRNSDIFKTYQMSLSNIQLPMLFTNSSRAMVLNDLEAGSDRAGSGDQAGTAAVSGAEISCVASEITSAGGVPPETSGYGFRKRRTGGNFAESGPVSAHKGLQKTDLSSATLHSSEQPGALAVDRAGFHKGCLSSNESLTTGTGHFLSKGSSLAGSNSISGASACGGGLIGGAGSITGTRNSREGGASKDKDKDLGSNLQKNREREKGIVHQKQAQREWMQMNTSSSSLIGPSLLWFENSIFRYPAEIEYFLYDRDPIKPVEVSFINRNGLILDPVDQERNRNTIWTFSEIRLFVEKYLMYPKDFRRIASFMEHKAVKDCIDFYYKYKYALGLKRILRLAHHLKGGQYKGNLASGVDSAPSMNSNQVTISGGDEETGLHAGAPDSDLGEWRGTGNIQPWDQVKEEQRQEETQIWESPVSTTRCIEIIRSKKHSYREQLIDEMLGTLTVDSAYDAAMRDFYGRQCFGTLGNMNVFTERLLSRSSLRRMLRKPSTLFRLPILENGEVSGREQGGSRDGEERREEACGVPGVSWSFYDELVYKFLFRVHGDTSALGSAKKYVLDNLSNGYILPKDVGALISPYYNVSIQNRSGSSNIHLPSNIPIIFDHSEYKDRESLLNSWADPNISIGDFRAAVYLYLNQLSPEGAGGTGTGSPGTGGGSLLDSLTVSPPSVGKRELSGAQEGSSFGAVLNAGIPKPRPGGVGDAAGEKPRQTRRRRGAASLSSREPAAREISSRGDLARSPGEEGVSARADKIPRLESPVGALEGGTISSSEGPGGAFGGGRTSGLPNSGGQVPVVPGNFLFGGVIPPMIGLNGGGSTGACLEGGFNMFPPGMLFGGALGGQMGVGAPSGIGMGFGGIPGVETGLLPAGLGMGLGMAQAQGQGQSQVQGTGVGLAQDPCSQTWGGVLVNQYIQQQLAFQQTLQEQVKNAQSRAEGGADRSSAGSLGPLQQSCPTGVVGNPINQMIFGTLLNGGSSNLLAQTFPSASSQPGQGMPEKVEAQLGMDPGSSSPFGTGTKQLEPKPDAEAERGSPRAASTPKQEEGTVRLSTSPSSQIPTIDAYPTKSGSENLREMLSSAPKTENCSGLPMHQPFPQLPAFPHTQSLTQPQAFPSFLQFQQLFHQQLLQQQQYQQQQYQQQQYQQQQKPHQINQHLLQPQQLPHGNAPGNQTPFTSSNRGPGDVLNFILQQQQQQQLQFMGNPMLGLIGVPQGAVQGGRRTNIQGVGPGVGPGPGIQAPNPNQA